MSRIAQVRSRAWMRALVLLAGLALAGTAAAQNVAPFTIAPFGPSTLTVHEFGSVTVNARVLDANSAPVQGQQVDWVAVGCGSVSPAASNTSFAAPSVIGGVASTTFSAPAVAGTCTVEARTFDGFPIILRSPDGRAQPAGTAGPATFTINVENVGMSIVDPAGGTASILTNATRQLEVYWGSANLAKVGTTIDWSILPGSPGGGNLASPTITNGSGRSTVQFSASVAGVYTIRAQEIGCTFCGPSFQDFTITVADPSADTHVAMSDSPDPVAPDGTITYSVDVGNGGPQDATSLVLTGALVAPLVFDSVAMPAGWTCSTPTVGSSGGISCNKALLGASVLDTFTFVARVTGNPAAGTILNTAFNVAAAETDPDPADQDASADTIVVAAPSMSLVKLLANTDDNDGSGDVTEGDELDYEITATNTGNTALTNVAIGDDHFAATQSCPTVAIGATCVLTGSYVVTGADVTAGQVDNTATATADELASPETATLTTPVFFHPAPAMTLAKAQTGNADNDGSGSITEGDVLTYQVTATNTGNVTLTNLQIDDPKLSPTFEVCSGVSPGGSCVLTGTWTVTHAEALAGEVVNDASAVSTEITTPVTASLTTPVIGVPDLAVDKVLTGDFDMDGSGDISVGDELYYDVTATNTGSANLTGVVVSDDHYGGTQACATLVPNDTCVLSIIYTVQPADAVAGSVTNVGSATSNEVPGPVTDSVTTPVAALPPALTIISGDGSAGYGGQTATLVVQLLDGAGNPMPGATINWTGGNNGTTTTGADGRSTNTYTFNGTTGNPTVTAAYLPASIEVQFSLQSISAALGVVSGDNQTGATGTALPQPLVVRATDDGTPMEGVPIQWTVLSGDASVDPVSTGTDVDGLASTVVTFGTTPGTVQIQAQRTDGSGETAVFIATSTLNRTLLIHDGDNQSGATGTTLPLNLVVEAQDNGVGVDGVVINFSVLPGGDATVGTCCGTTAGGGFAGTSLTFGTTPGTVQVRAERADDPSVFVVFTATSTLTRTLVIHDGNLQVGAINQILPVDLVVQAFDNGVPADDELINFSLVSGTATLGSSDDVTDASGFAEMLVELGDTPGPVQIRAERNDDPTVFVLFDLTIAAPGLIVVSGHDQDGVPGQPGTEPLVVEYRDGTPANVPLAGRTITWTQASGDATPTSATSTTGADGRAQMTFTYGLPGDSVITASDGAAATASFTVHALAAALTVTGGDNQTGLVHTVADAPLQVTLRDGLGNPMVGHTIDWVVAGPGVLASATSTTDASGQAEMTLTFGATPGAITVTASNVDAGGPVIFNATAVNPVLGVASGDGQAAPVNTTLPQPLVVQVAEVMIAAAKRGRIDAQGLAGVPVTFTVTTGGGSTAPTVAMTDASGRAQTTWTLGPVEGAQTVTASVPGGASVTFTATATIARTLSIVSGDGQAGAPGASLPNPLVVHAQDNGADAAGVAINWSVVGGAATVTPGDATDGGGLADATVTLGAVAGAVSIRAERADDPTVYVLFDANAAKLQLIPGLTPEELELAIVIDDTCATLAGESTLTPAQQDFLARCQELIESSILDPGATTDALDALLPGLAVAMQEASFWAAQAQFQNLKARIAALRSGTQGSSFQGLALTNSSGTLSLDSLVQSFAQDDAAPSGEAGRDFQRWGFFASGTIGRGEAEEGSHRPAYDYDINGLTLGLDYRYSDQFIFGAALGYTRQDMDLRGQPGTMDMSGWSVSAYATWYRDNSWYTDGVVTWGRNSFDLLRRITYTIPTPGGGATTIDQTARSDSDGDMLEAAFTFGRDFQAGGWSIGPYGRLLYTKLDFDRIVDEMAPGAGMGLGLEVDARTLTSVASEVGAKFTYAHSTDWGVVTPHLQIEWEHEFKDDPKALTARFLADPNGTPFTLSGEEIDTDYFRMSVGLSIIMTRGRSGFVLYERTVGREGFDQSNLGFGLRIEF